jgi:hypothetical protein
MAQILFLVILATAFSSALPLALPLCAAYLLLRHLTERFYFVKHYTRTPAYDAKLFHAAYALLPLALVGKLVATAVLYGDTPDGDVTFYLQLLVFLFWLSVDRGLWRWLLTLRQGGGTVGGSSAGGGPKPLQTEADLAESTSHQLGRMRGSLPSYDPFPQSLHPSVLHPSERAAWAPCMRWANPARLPVFATCPNCFGPVAVNRDAPSATHVCSAVDSPAYDGRIMETEGLLLPPAERVRRLELRKEESGLLGEAVAAAEAAAAIEAGEVTAEATAGATGEGVLHDASMGGRAAGVGGRADGVGEPAPGARQPAVRQPAWLQAQAVASRGNGPTGGESRLLQTGAEGGQQAAGDEARLLPAAGRASAGSGWWVRRASHGAPGLEMARLLEPGRADSATTDGEGASSVGSGARVVSFSASSIRDGSSRGDSGEAPLGRVPPPRHASWSRLPRIGGASALRAFGSWSEARAWIESQLRVPERAGPLGPSADDVATDDGERYTYTGVPTLLLPPEAPPPPRRHVVVRDFWNTKHDCRTVHAGGALTDETPLGVQFVALARTGPEPPAGLPPPEGCVTVSAYRNERGQVTLRLGTPKRGETFLDDIVGVPAFDAWEKPDGKVGTVPIFEFENVRSKRLTVHAAPPWDEEEPTSATPLFHALPPAAAYAAAVGARGRELSSAEPDGGGDAGAEALLGLSSAGRAAGVEEVLAEYRGGGREPKKHEWVVGFTRDLCEIGTLAWRLIEAETRAGMARQMEAHLELGDGLGSDDGSQVHARPCHHSFSFYILYPS